MFDPFFNVVDMLRIQAGYYGCGEEVWPWIEEMLERLDLKAKRGASMRALSGGMKRRVLIGQALVHKPPVIVLDEPTAGVDVELRQSLWQFIRRLNRDGHTIVLTTHYLEEAEALCGRIAMLKRGEIVASDTTQNLLNSFSGCQVKLKLAPPGLPAGLQALLTQGDAEDCLVALEGYDRVEGVLAALRTAGVRVLEMEVAQPDLEEVFVKIMNH